MKQKSQNKLNYMQKLYKAFPNNFVHFVVLAFVNFETWRFF